MIDRNNSCIPCRLCGGEAISTFSLIVLNKHSVQYFRCTACHSLETEEPYWLEEAYSTTAGTGEADGAALNLNKLDTLAAYRNIRNMGAVMLTAKMLNAQNIVDYGGGDGLLCRLLRDQGLNAFVTDPHASPTYAQGFDQPNFSRPDLVTAFEVFEHLSNPREELAAMFAAQPTAFLASTFTYSGEGPDWWYLIPDTGHHIFFYSEAALQMIAERHGYELLRPGGYILFVKSGHLSAARRKFLALALREKPMRLYRALLNFRPPVPEQADRPQVGQ
jgi:hypothetical protein